MRLCKFIYKKESLKKGKLERKKKMKLFQPYKIK